MDKFTFYANRNGAMWWRCNNCQNLTRGRPDVCPVCNGRSSEIGDVNPNTDEAFEKSIQKLKDIMAKYER